MPSDHHSDAEPASCRDCSVRHHGTCGVLDLQQLDLLSRHTRTVRHPAGAEVFGDETAITSYANVVSGVIKLLKVLKDGRQQVVGLKFAPDFMGRVFAADNTISAEAASDVELCQVPKAILDGLMEDSRTLERRLMQDALRELDEAREWMVTLGRKSAAERLASFLHLIALHVHPDLETRPRPVEFDLPLTRSDIADFLGLSIETVSRQLTEIRRLGIVVIRNKRHVTIPDYDRLKRRGG